MKRFWKEVSVEPADGGWQVALDGRGIKTQGGRAPQVVPTRALAEALAAEWAAQGDEVDPKAFVLRDLADYAIDRVAPDPAAAAERLLPFAETDTLCYRADPDEPLYRHQQEVWEPIVAACEARQGLCFERVSGIVHKPQPPATLAQLRKVLRELDPFRLAALETMTALAASLIVGLAALENDADPEALFAAAHKEEDWQADLWGRDAEAERARAIRREAFMRAAQFARLAHAGPAAGSS